ncbi:MDR family MFS transporter [Actinocatenispora rupis]|uniref:MFS transporter n=1 Tax=Actinocatenispora rupis TaxID=519421 RepID=A0A8J3NCQ4_9ACTN|nr:MDR family MFS transporter [Actinocatenispora rupis]GID14256.1 MFS transporter [Actinocatenispora rupis]
MTATASDASVGAEAAGQRPRYTHKQILEVLAALLMALLTSMISTSVVSTALPTIVGELGGQDKLSWIASATLLTMTASTPLWGKMSDIFGRKLLFQLSLVIFVVSCAAAGFSQNMTEMIVARAFQGIGAGGLSALTQVILGDIVEPRERGRYSGYLGAAFGVSTVAGPLLGGFLVDGPGWRYCFFVSIPLAVVAFAMIQKILKLPKVKRNTRVDWLGATFLTGGSALLVGVLSFGGKEFAWNSAWTYALGAVALLCFVGAVFAERHARDPILPPRLFRNRTFVLTGTASLLVGVAMFGGIIYLPQYLQIVQGMSPTASGLMTLPMVLAMFLFSITIGRVITRTGRWKVFPVVGMLVVALGMFLLSRLHVDSSHLAIGAYVAVLGAGLGMTMQTLILAAQNAVQRTDMAATTSGVSYFRSLGGAIGVAAFGAILTNRLTGENTRLARAAHLPATGGTGLDPSSLGSPEAIHKLPDIVQTVVLQGFTNSLHTVFLTAVPVAVAGWLAVLFLKELPLRSSQSAPAPVAAASAAGVSGGAVGGASASGGAGVAGAVGGPGSAGPSGDSGGSGSAGTSWDSGTGGAGSVGVAGSPGAGESTGEGMAPAATVATGGLSRDDALVSGLLLSLVAQRIDHLDGDASPLVPALASLVPDDGGSEGERARLAVERVIRPSALALMRRAHAADGGVA